MPEVVHMNNWPERGIPPTLELYGLMVKYCEDSGSPTKWTYGEWADWWHYVALLPGWQERAAKRYRMGFADAVEAGLVALGRYADGTLAWVATDSEPLSSSQEASGR